MEKAVLFFTIVAVALIMILLVVILFIIDKRAMKLSFWDERGKRRKQTIGAFDEYIIIDDLANRFEFRLAGLLCDAGAPIVRNQMMVVCLPKRGEFLELHVYDEKNGIAYVDKIEHVIYKREKELFPKRKLVWKLSNRDKGDELMTHCETLLLPCDLSLKWRAAAAVYSAVTGVIV